MIAAALLVALAAAGDPCLAADEAGRPYRVCFDPGNRVEAALGVRAGEAGAAGGALDLSAAWRWRGDLRGGAGSGPVEWLRDQQIVEAGARTAGGQVLAAEGLAWQGIFIRRLAEPFILLPGPNPIRLPFPFDVGVAIEAGGVAWERARERLLELRLLRSTLLLDLSRHAGWLRRAAFGPELSYGLGVERGRAPVHALVPFSGGLATVAVQSADGLWAGDLAVRAGGVLRVPGAMQGYAEARLRQERVVLALDDQPLSLGLTLLAAHGAGPARLEGALVLRLGIE